MYRALGFHVLIFKLVKALRIMYFGIRGSRFGVLLLHLYEYYYNFEAVALFRNDTFRKWRFQRFLDTGVIFSNSYYWHFKISTGVLLFSAVFQKTNHHSAEKEEFVLPVNLAEKRKTTSINISIHSHPSTFIHNTS